MKQNKKGILKDLKKTENITTNVKVSMLVEDKDVKPLDEVDFEDVSEIDFNKKVEFGIFDTGGKTEITFEVGSIVINKKDFEESVKKYITRNKCIKKLKSLDKKR